MDEQPPAQVTVEAVQRHQRRLLMEFAAANLLGVSILGAYLILFAPRRVELLPTRDLRALVVVLAIGAVVALVASWHVARPLCRWLAQTAVQDGQQHDPEGAPSRLRIALVLQPPVQAGIALFAWIVFSVLVTVLQAFVIDDDPRLVLTSLVGIFVPGVVAAAVTYLRVESSWQPWFPVVFGGGDPVSLPLPAASRLATRLRWGFVLGTVVPLVLIASLTTFRAYAVDPTRSQSTSETLRTEAATLRVELEGLADRVSPEEAAAVSERLDRIEANLEVVEGEIATVERLAWFVALAGILASGIVYVNVRKSITHPLHALEKSMEQVERGNLDVRVPVDRLDEFGRLERGFNQMTRGLRSRSQLVDLLGAQVGDQVAALSIARTEDPDDGEHPSLAGEIRVASALFVDLAAFSTLAETLSPDDLAAILNVVFGRIVSAVERHGGLVNKFQGDAVLAVFGAPEAAPTHAVQATWAAAGVAAALEDLGIEFGIGVSSGEVFAGNVGSEHRYEYTVIGDPVNEAARLQELTRTLGRRVLLSGPTSELVRSEGDARLVASIVPLEPVVLRGKSEPTAICSLSPQLWRSHMQEEPIVGQDEPTHGEPQSEPDPSMGAENPTMRAARDT